MKPSPTKCPKCKAEAECTDWNEVDIGVGMQTFDHSYTCPEHGEFGWTSIGGELVFRDDVPLATAPIGSPDMDDDVKAHQLERLRK